MSPLERVKCLDLLMKNHIFQAENVRFCIWNGIERNGYNDWDGMGGMEWNGNEE